MNDYDRSDEYVNDYDESDEYMNYYDRSDEYMNDYDRSDQYMNDYDRSDEYRNGIFFAKFLLSSEVLSPKGQARRRHFNSDGQAALRRMLSYWEHVQRSTVGRYEHYEDDVKKHQ